MGNIRTLVRRCRLDSGYGEIDNLTYTYTGNRLAKVTDAVTTPVTYQGAFHFVDRANTADEYAYDTNGNITRDLNRNITSITYNSLNLPSVITLSGDKSVTYGYDAAGRKLSAVYKSGTTITTSRDYVGNKVYNNGTLGMVLTEEGYATVSGTPAYYHHLKDHQGNNRVVISQGGAVQEVNHYYPFGGLFGEGVQPSIQRYKYNGKELDREFGLDMYDYGARHYDAALGRWFTVDRLSEAKPGLTIYHYCSNNPINKIDLGGYWDVRVHVHNNRETFGFGFLRVTDRNGNVVFKAFVGVQGTNLKENNFNRRIRTRTNADTPTGTYEILGWSSRLSNFDRGSYGPNDVLELNYIEGEAAGLRNGMHAHGGRQEGYERPSLRPTLGCIRMMDEDILKMKKITTKLEKTIRKRKVIIFMS